MNPKEWDCVRLNAYQRSGDSVPDKIRPFCSWNEVIEDLSNAIRHRIVVATSRFVSIVHVGSRAKALFAANS